MIPIPRTTLDRALDLAIAALTVVIVMEQRGVQVRPLVLRGLAAGTGAVARSAGRLSLAAEAAYAREVAP